MRHRYTIAGPCEWCGRTNTMSLLHKDGGQCDAFESEHDHVWVDSGSCLARVVDVVVGEGATRRMLDKGPEVEACSLCGLLRMKAPNLAPDPRV